MKRKNGKRRVIVAALRDYREREGITQREAAQRLELEVATYRSYENGNRVIPAEVAVHIEKRICIPREQVRPDIFRRQVA